MNIRGGGGGGRYGLGIREDFRELNPVLDR